MTTRRFAVALAALLLAGPPFEPTAAAAAPASSSVFQVKSACLRTLSESEVGGLSTADLRLYVTICSRMPAALAALGDPPAPSASPDLAPTTPTLAARKAAIAAQMTEVRLEAALATVALVQTDAKDAALQSAADQKAAAASSDESKKECRDLSTTESALTGGLALNPAAYGKTYIGIAALIAPLFFPNCDTPPAPKAQSPQPDPTKQQLQSQVDSLTQQLNALTAEFNSL